MWAWPCASKWVSGESGRSCGKHSRKHHAGMIGDRHSSAARASNRLPAAPASPACARPARCVLRCSPVMPAPALRAGPPAVARRLGVRRLRRRRRTPARRRRSCARSAATRTTSTTRCCSSTCSRSGSRCVAAARARGDIGADIDERFAWEAFLVRDRSVNAFALPGGYVGVHLGLIAITARATSWPRCWRTSCRTSRSATSRAASPTASASR